MTEVFAQAVRTPEAPALIDARGRRTSYRELAAEVRAVSGGLRAHGLRGGDGVLFSIRPSPDALVLALAVVAASGTIVFADPGAGPQLFASRVATAAPTWSAAESLLYAISGVRPARAYARRRGLLLPDLGALPLRHLYSGPWLPGVPRGAMSLRQLHGVPAEPTVEQDAPAVVVFTSGTTARPRAVVHTMRSLSAGLDLLRQRLSLGPGDVVHTDQLMLGLPALAGGACWSMPGTPLNPDEFATQLAHRRATHAFLVPADAARALDVAPRWPAHVRGVLLGAAPVLPSLLRRVVNAAPQAEVLSIYGMTEAAPLAVSSAGDKLAHAESGATGDLLGAPLAGITAKIVDDELVVAGPNLCAGYLGQPPLAELNTGDLCRLDSDGRLVMLGRKKDMIIRGEHNIYPGLYEPLVCALPGVAEALLVGLADAHGDERVVLAVVLADGAGENTVRLIRRRLPELIDAKALPDRIVVLPELPRTGRSHKPDREALRCALR